MGNDNVHAKHRLRMKKRFRDKGLDSFSDHEVLELLLFFGIPMKNTNETAHLLMNRFGSLAGVLEADFDDLKREEGLGENSATLLSLMPELFRRYSLDKQINDGTFESMDEIGNYLVNHFIGAVREQVEILLFDASMKLTAHITLHEGSMTSTAINAERVAEIVFSHHATNFVLAHNHPSGNPEPSDTDLFMTREIYRAFLPFNKYMLDHIIVAGGQYNQILRRSLAIYDE